MEQEDIAAFTAGLINQVQKHPRIKTHLDAEVASIKGHIGKFHVTLAQGSKNLEVTGGAIIVATGAQAAKTAEFLYGQSERVLTQAELESKLHEKTWPAKGQNIVMIQCVGSRNEKHPYCSRICCSMAVKNALAVKKLDPAAQRGRLVRAARGVYRMGRCAGHEPLPLNTGRPSYGHNPATARSGLRSHTRRPF